jgi:ABC-2 type transport system permease protein
MDLSNIFHIMAKDAKQSLKNMSLVIVLAIAIFLPLMMSTMMSSITSSANQTVMIGVHDRGANHNYTDFLETVSLYNVSFWGSLDEMNNSIRNGAIVGGIDIPENFDGDIAAGRKPTLNLITDPASFKSLVFTESCREITMNYAGLEYPLSINTESVVQPAPGSSAAGSGFTGFSTPSLLLISILIVGISVLPATLTTEKEKKTISALLATPVTQMDVILGKAAFGLGVTVVISVIVTYLSNSLTGNVPLAFLFILLGAMAFNGVGLLIAIYSNSYQTASILSSVVMVPIMMFTFLYQIIDELKAIGAFLPSTYLMNGLNDVILYNKGLSDELVNLAVLLALTVVIYAIIYVSIRRKGLAA